MWEQLAALFVNSCNVVTSSTLPCQLNILLHCDFQHAASSTFDLDVLGTNREPNREWILLENNYLIRQVVKQLCFIM